MPQIRGLKQIDYSWDQEFCSQRAIIEDYFLRPKTGRVLRPYRKQPSAVTRGWVRLKISRFVRKVPFHLVKLPRNSRSLVPVHFGA